MKTYPKAAHPNKGTGHGTGLMHCVGLAEILQRDRYRKAAKRHSRGRFIKQPETPDSAHRSRYWGKRARTVAELLRRSGIVNQNIGDLGLW